MDTPSLSQIHLTWNEIPRDSATGVITRYEVQFEPVDRSLPITTVFTDTPMYMITNLSRGTNYLVLVTAFSLFGRGTLLNETVQTLSEPRKLCVPV